jgi:hypothetical protein
MKKDTRERADLIVPFSTFPHAADIRSYSGIWDKARNVWTVPADRLEACKACLIREEGYRSEDAKKKRPGGDHITMVQAFREKNGF